MRPSIRLYCVNCTVGFVWAYDFVGPKQRYSHLFRSRAVEHALGATAAHSARMQQAPVSTVQDMHNKTVPVLCGQLTDQAWEEAQGATDLVLGIDGFAIKKGHTYNTRIHNLKGETMLDLLPGRKLDDLRAYASEHPSLERALSTILLIFNGGGSHLEFRRLIWRPLHRLDSTSLSWKEHNTTHFSPIDPLS